MSYDTARQQHISWLNKQIKEKMSALAEAEVRLSQLRADIEYFKLMLNPTFRTPSVINVNY